MQTHNNIMQQNNNNLINNPKTNNTHPTTIPQPSSLRTHASSSTTQACAACKYQRRKCASDCILAPYFPHDRQRQFLNAHRLFGVSNIVKIVKHLEPPAKDHAMRTIIFQSDARAADPVGGCHRIIRDLEQRINLARAELEIVLHHLALCRAARQQMLQVGPPQSDIVGDHSIVDPFAVDDIDDSWGCMNGNAESNTSSSFQHQNLNLRVEEYNDDINPILEQLSCDDDVREVEFKFDSNGNIISSISDAYAEDKSTFKEEDMCFPYDLEDHDLKAAATFFSLTNL